ncbi:hypothetical protein CFP56_016369 [Quercus suber]|uniref:Uncharacterized protein n=1 Tax=Quercus suber TaxID=58331 RepID=A0AAW0KQB0_QUESU
MKEMRLMQGKQKHGSS